MPKYFQESSHTIYVSDAAIDDVPDDLVEVNEGLDGPPPPARLRRTLSSYGDDVPDVTYFSMSTQTFVKGQFDLNDRSNGDLRVIEGTQPYGAYEPSAVPGHGR
jgi:hypothetical protein